MSHGVDNTKVTRVVKSNSLDYTSVPSAELINGRMLNLYECPKDIPVKIWKKTSKQSRLEVVWRSLPRKKRIHIVVSMMADYYGAEKFEWYEI